MNRVVLFPLPGGEGAGGGGSASTQNLFRQHTLTLPSPSRERGSKLPEAA